MYKRISATIFAGIIFFALTLAAQNLNDDYDGMPKPLSVKKPTARIDEAIGVMTKGQLCNLTMNYGQISDTRLEDVGNAPTDDFFNFRYPKTKPYGSMCDDFAIFFATEKNSKNGDNGNFIDAYTANGNEDWIAKDGSLGATHYDGEGDYPMIKYVDGTTPYLAHSDLPQTWPLDQSGNPFWPGYFRRNPVTGQVFEGEFASDRDVYGVFTDANNRQGNVIGIEIEQMAYCYGRPYAEDFHFYELFIHNKSGALVQGSYFGIYLDPDCSDYSQEILIVPEGYGFTDRYPIVMQRDFDGDVGGCTLPNSLGRLEDMDFGVVFLETPQNQGITSFHYYTDAGPTFDEVMWPIVSGQPTDPDVATLAAEYFHGSNPKIDDVSLITTKSDLVYIAASGPFDFAPDEMVKFTIAVVVGNTDDDFMKNCQMAIQMFEKGFVGPAAPPGPELWALSGDGKVTLYWDKSSELKPDPLTGEIDFEGYKIYRSEDGGATWGDKITNSKGDVIGYIPIAQFDLKNNIQGDDPINPNNYLGDNTGLQYVYVDRNVINGISYSYTVTAYDRGDATATIPSFETAKGVGSAEKHFVEVIPHPDPLALQAAAAHSLTQISGKGKGEIQIDVVDPAQYLAYKTAKQYASDPIFKIIFEEFPATKFSLYDASAMNSPIRQSLNFQDDLLPIITDLGIKLTIVSQQQLGGIQAITDESGKDVFGSGKLDHTGSWYLTGKDLTTASLEARTNNYELRFTSQGSIAYLPGKKVTALMQVPFEIWRIYPDTAQVICEYNDKNKNLLFEEKEFIYISNDLYPATKPSIGDTLTINFPASVPIQISFEKAPATATKPEGGRLPTEGQKVVITSNCSFSDGTGFDPNSMASKGDVFTFSIRPATVDKSLEGDLLDQVKVVPNPYVVTSLFDPRQNVHSIKFMYLPAQCDITIYSLSGVKIKEIRHDDNTGIENWNMTNDFGQDISFGVYVFVVTTSEGKNKVGKFAIIK
ncbi:MAG: hypothetical protein MUC94_04380 [bacterium]|nr:hypothetical protein [bacterium]